MCSCSNTSAFAWAGFVIINGALIGLIGLLGGSSWVAAFVLTLLYALALLAAAFFFWKDGSARQTMVRTATRTTRR